VIHVVEAECVFLQINVSVIQDTLVNTVNTLYVTVPFRTWHLCAVPTEHVPPRITVLVNLVSMVSSVKHGCVIISS